MKLIWYLNVCCNYSSHMVIFKSYVHIEILSSHHCNAILCALYTEHIAHAMFEPNVILYWTKDTESQACKQLELFDGYALLAVFISLWTRNVDFWFTWIRCDLFKCFCSWHFETIRFWVCAWILIFIKCSRWFGFFVSFSSALHIILWEFCFLKCMQ